MIPRRSKKKDERELRKHDIKKPSVKQQRKLSTESTNYDGVNIPEKTLCNDEKMALKTVNENNNVSCLRIYHITTVLLFPKNMQMRKK